MAPIDQDSHGIGSYIEKINEEFAETGKTISGDAVSISVSAGYSGPLPLRIRGTWNSPAGAPTPTSVSFQNHNYVLVAEADDGNVYLLSLADPDAPADVKSYNQASTGSNSSIGAGSSDAALFHPDDTDYGEKIDVYHINGMGADQVANGSVSVAAGYTVGDPSRDIVALAGQGNNTAVASFSLWDTQTGTFTQLAEEIAFNNDGTVNDMDFAGDFLVAVIDNTFELWDVSDAANPSFVTSLTGSTHISGAALNGDGYAFLSGDGVGSNNRTGILAYEVSSSGVTFVENIVATADQFDFIEADGRRGVFSYNDDGNSIGINLAWDFGYGNQPSDFDNWGPQDGTFYPINGVDLDGEFAVYSIDGVGAKVLGGF